MTTIDYRGKTWYMFSKVSPTATQLEGTRTNVTAQVTTMRPVAEAA